MILILIKTNYSIIEHLNKIEIPIIDAQNH